MGKENIFIINYFNKGEMRWYEEVKCNHREKYINILTGEEYDSLSKAAKAKLEYIKQGQMNIEDKEQSSKAEELEEYLNNYNETNGTNTYEEGDIQGKLISGKLKKGKISHKKLEGYTIAEETSDE